MTLQASPEFKGIKTNPWPWAGQRPRLQASPEFKGIKTAECLHPAQCFELQASPEFKGIKTSRAESAPIKAASSQP